MNTLGFALLPIAALLAVGGVIVALATARQTPQSMVAVLLWALAGVNAACAPLLFLWRRSLCRSYDPNSEDVEVRKKLGQARSVDKEEFLKQVQREQANDKAATSTREAAQEDLSRQRQDEALLDDLSPSFFKGDYLDSLREKRRQKAARKRQDQNAEKTERSEDDSADSAD
jgi:hypothetical protein